MDSTTSRFRFRDQENGDSTESDTSTGDSFSSGVDDDESKLKTMTGKGIKRLCSELLELKKASDDDFHRNVYSNYSAFVRIFKEVEGLENELMELKQYISTQRKLVYDLMHGIYLEVLSEESIESIIEDIPDTVNNSDTVNNPLSELETYTNVITETLDILMSEHRLDEALLILEMESTNLQKILSGEDFPPEIFVSYNSAVLQRRKRLGDQFVLLAEHPRVASPEFQKALSGLCRLGDSYRANLLLLLFYSSRFEHGILDLQCSKPFLHETYMKELAKCAFSVISQAGRTFVTLHGETSPYTSELMQWAREKTEVFVSYFDKYVNSISETTGGLSLAVEAVQHAVSFCSLLESQKILLRPYLIKLIRPCMERVLQMHIDHFKKVIGISMSTDTWIPGKYLVSGLLRETHSNVGIDGKLEYCLLTSSGRKFATVMQAIIEDVMPLVRLQMESSILKGLYDLFNAYVDNLQICIPNKENAIEKGSQRTNLANTLYEQLSLLANAPTLVIHFFSCVAESIFKGIKCSDDGELIEVTEHLQQRELNSWILSLEEASDRLRVYFCQQFASRVMSLQDGGILSPETNENGQSESDSLHDLQPSITFQALFLQLRQLEKLAREVFVGMDWEVEDLLRESMEAVFLWLSNNQEFWAVMGESSTTEQSSGFQQFLLDMQFLVEIARFGGYFSDNLMDASLGLVECMETTFLAAGLDPNSDILYDGLAAEAAKAAIDKLLDIEKTKLPPVEGSAGTLAKQKYRDAGDSVEEGGRRYSKDSVGLEYGKTANGAEATISKLQDMGKTEMTLMEESTGIHEDADCDDIARSLSNNVVDLEDPRAANSANAMTPMFREIDETEVMPSETSAGVLIEDSDKEAAEICVEDAASSFSDSDSMLGEQVANVANLVTEDIAEPKLLAVGTELVRGEDSSDLRDGCRTNEAETVRKTANGAEATISKLQDMGKAEMTLMEEPTGIHQEVHCDGIARSLSNNVVDLEDPRAANSGNAITPMFQEIDETKVMPSETSAGVLIEDSDKEDAEICVEDAASSFSDSDSMSDEQVANVANLVTEDIAKPELLAVGTELVLGEDSSNLRDGWRTNEAETVSYEQQESDRVELPSMEWYEFILDEGSAEQKKTGIDNSVEDKGA